MANLVIMESPSKANTVKSYLGSNYKVIATVGHLRDLPKSTLGVDIENNFEAHYINIRGKGDIIKDIKKEAKNANKIFLATDPDREGEAISWHLANVLGIPVEKTMRVTFNEITKSVVKSAIKNPRNIDMNLVDAQQARRILDRIVGYKISPLLWKSVKSGLSAGRVQSVATRILVEREEEIKSFVPEEFWNIDVSLVSSDGKPFVVHFFGDKKGRIDICSESEAMKIVDAVSGAQFRVTDVKRSTRHKLPAPPFTTSTLQQEAYRKLGFQSQKIMKVAQELYEGINVGSENGGMQGLITYMRTDSLRVSAEAQEAARVYIAEKYGEKYNTEEPRVFKSKSGIQDAHEAIRPSNVALDPQRIKQYLTGDQFKLYKLIWSRFVASQMESAELSTLTVDVEAAGYVFRTGGYTVTFQGYMTVYEESVDESAKGAHRADPEEQKNVKIPELCVGDEPTFDGIDPTKHFTEPPPRYNEASLVKFLEEKGIGRPSTYAPIITTIITRNYVKRDKKMLVPTPLGEITTKLMCENFEQIVDYEFTADMEDKLDAIENNEQTLGGVLEEFWKDFSKQLDVATDKLGSVNIEVPVEETDIICDKCGSRMIVKNGKFGKFAACPNFPKCRNTKPLDAKADNAEAEEKVEEKKEEKKLIVAEDMKCEKCGGDMVLRNGKFGSFYACANYPACKYTKQRIKEVGVPCPKCGSKIVVRYSKSKTVFYGCERYPECDFSSWDMPVAEKCPDCGKNLYVKKGKQLLVCHDEACGFSKPYFEQEK
ncbi:MAG: type I DNA topoisomerase [Ruminococcaceae bacterium]|nr:type I DNA topoisomerase [Oscillospiraceae bacterium]